MKSISDYTGEQALEMWADLFDQFAEILLDKDIIAVTTKGKVDIQTAARLAIKNHRTALLDIFKYIGADVNGASLFANVVTLITEMILGGKMSTFFGQSTQGTSDAASFGNVTENTGDAAK